MKIYIYTTNTYREKGIYKIGQTDRDTQSRIKEQDSTSNPEPLIKIMDWDVPAYIRDKDIHSELQKKGYQKTRNDREWFLLHNQDPRAVVHEIICELDYKFKNQSTHVIVGDQNWLNNYYHAKSQNKFLKENDSENIYNEIQKVIDYQYEVYDVKFKTLYFPQGDIDNASAVLTSMKNNSSYLDSKFKELPITPKIAKLRQRHNYYKHGIDDVEKFIQNNSPLVLHSANVGKVSDNSNIDTLYTICEFLFVKLPTLFFILVVVALLIKNYNE